MPVCVYVCICVCVGECGMMGEAIEQVKVMMDDDVSNLFTHPK